MPTYVYRRADGSTFEVFQRITEDALEECPTTGQPVRRVISGGTGFILKGSGFYQTDYVNGGNGTAAPQEEKAKKEQSEDSTESQGTSDKTESTETKETAASEG